MCKRLTFLSFFPSLFFRQVMWHSETTPLTDVELREPGLWLTASVFTVWSSLIGFKCARHMRDVPIDHQYIFPG